MADKLTESFNAFDDELVRIEANNSANVKELFHTLETELTGKTLPYPLRYEIRLG